MTEPRVVDQELVVHLFAPTDGPRAQAAYAELQQIWLRCRSLLGMVDPIPGTGLGNHLPPALSDIPADPATPELAIAAQERPGAAGQAIIRRHHDVLNMSVALSPTDGPSDTRDDEPGWAEFDLRWSAVAGAWSGALLAAARIFQARLVDATPAAVRHLGLRARPLLPAAAEADGWWDDGVATPGGFALWETSPRRDTRPERSFLILAPVERDPDLSAWTWSRGDVAIPPLGRYLLHVAKIRYELRIWLAAGGSDGARDLLDALLSALDATASSIRASDQPAVDPAQPDALAAHELTAATTAMRVRQIRRTVEIAQSNLRLALGAGASALLDYSGPLADDARLAEWFITRLDDDLFYLADAARHAGSAGDLVRRVTRQSSPPAAPVAPDAMEPTPAGPSPTATTPDLRRRVFVIHGHDREIRRRMHDFLRRLDLEPLEPEACIQATGKATPTNAEITLAAVAAAQAAMVLLTPDEAVNRNPALDGSVAVATELQAPRDTLFQAGIVWALYPDRTIVVRVGASHLPADFGGLSCIDLDDTPECRQQIANRLMLAGCDVKRTGTTWLESGLFGGSGADHRGL